MNLLFLALVQGRPRNSVLCAINILHFLLFRDARGVARPFLSALANVLQPSATLYVSWFPLGSFWSSLYEMPTVSIFPFICFSILTFLSDGEWLPNFVCPFS